MSPQQHGDPPSPTLYADSSWLLAAVPEGLVAVGPDAEVDVEIELTPARREPLLERLSKGATPEALAEAAGMGLSTARDLVGELERRGLLVTTRPEPPPEAGAPLIEALQALLSGSDLPALVWTADEALVVPPGLDQPRQRRLLRAFIAGIEPGRRRRAYAHAAAQHRPTVRGDVPAADRLASALAAADLGHERIGVFDLSIAGVTTSLDPPELDDLGVAETHRLGPVTRTMCVPLGGHGRSRTIAFARTSLPNLAHPGHPELGSWSIGVAPTCRQAETIARAEAAERFAVGQVSGRELVRGAETELDGVIPGSRLFSLNERQYAETEAVARYDPGARYLWMPAEAPDGSRRWVLAEAVFTPFRDFGGPARAVIASSSGAAAHATLDEARRRALCELVERDAFMWTWIQRVSRERIATASLPQELRERIAGLRRRGHRVDLVNLTLETVPVVLCAVRTGDELVVGAGCHPDPAQAAAKALDEASGPIHAVERRAALPAIEPREVRTAFDHMLLYRDAEIAAAAAFLHSSGDEIELAEIGLGTAAVDEPLAAVGDPLTIDLGCPAARPFRVVRAIVAGLVPMTFGFDREPLGMPELARARWTHDGRLLGAAIDLDRAGPLTPHPFA